MCKLFQELDSFLRNPKHVCASFSVHEIRKQPLIFQKTKILLELPVAQIRLVHNMRLETSIARNFQDAAQYFHSRPVTELLLAFF